MAVKISTQNRRVATAPVQESRDYISHVANMMDKTTAGVDSYIAPVRTNILKRFPVMFSLLTTFGVSTTFYGFEKVVDEIAVLNNNPLLMLILGMSILAFTGTLYKKLS